MTHIMLSASGYGLYLQATLTKDELRIFSVKARHGLLPYNKQRHGPLVDTLNNMWATTHCTRDIGLHITKTNKEFLDTLRACASKSPMPS